MEENKTNNPQRIKTLKVIRLDNSDTYIVYCTQELISDPDYEYGYNQFLEELFHAIDELGPIIPLCLKTDSKHFETDSNWGELTEDNKIIFGDNFDESNSHQEMNFDEFLKIYHEYKTLCSYKPDEIIFKRFGNEISMQGIWNE